MQDFRLAIRLLLRAPTHTAIALCALAVGLGTTIAIFGAVYAVLYRPLPLPDVDRLVVPAGVNRSRGIDRASVPYADYMDWREHRDVFSGVALYRPVTLDLSGTGVPEQLQAVGVTPEYFPVIGTRPIAGRVFNADDHAADASKVAVLSDRAWRARFGADRSLIGGTVRLGGDTVTVVGVVPEARMWPLGVDVWVPMVPATIPDEVKTRRDDMIFQSVARLQPGASIEEGRALVAGVAARVAAAHPESRKDWTTTLLPLRDSMIEPSTRLALHVLLGGAVLLLVIACVNLANLLLARGTDRAREIAVRAAMGASRGRIVRQLMVESAVLTVCGGAAGLVLAAWLIDVMGTWAADLLPVPGTIRLDAPVMVIAPSLMAAVTLISGLAPAWTAAAAGSFQTLRQEHTVGVGRGTERLRDALVVAQVALAIVLLAGAGLMLRSLAHLLHVDPGVDVAHVLTGRLSLPAARYEDDGARTRFWEQLVADAAALPGAEAAAAGSFVPAGGGGFGLGRVFLLEGQPEPPASADYGALWTVVTPDYFRALGMRVLRGRAFTPHDTASSTPVMIISETLAQQAFGARNPLGARMRSWRDENVLREVVGVISDVRYWGVTGLPPPVVYVPHAQDAYRSLTLIVRTGGDPAPLAEPLRRVVAQHDRDLAVADVRPLSVDAARSIAVPRFGAWLFALFAAAAALLSGIGIYGVMAYAVGRRRHEIAIRLALGATPTAASRLILRRGLLLTSVGALVGLAGGLGLGRLMSGMLYGVEGFDPATFLIVPALLCSIALMACAVPAWRAAAIEPLIALRSE